MFQDIFTRVHPVVAPTPGKAVAGPKWPEWLLMFDTETTLTTAQDFILGVYRLCRLVGQHYRCVEEGLIHPDDTTPEALAIFRHYATAHEPDLGVKTFPPKLTLPVLSRTQFVNRHLWKMFRTGGMVSGFHVAFDLSRLAVDWKASRDGGWSLILAQRRSKKTGQLENNPERPRIKITARSSKSAFFSLTMPVRPKEWPHKGRFLDVRTFAFALFDESFSLETLCEHFHLKGKVDHEPSGRVSAAELNYCRGDVRATVDCLNRLKDEFDAHPISLHPDQAVSPASIAKAYFDVMGIVPPREKFDTPDEIHGIAMQSYYGGRAECRIRHQEMPVIHTDFKSQSATVNTLLGNFDVLTAERVRFEDATRDLRKFLAGLKPDDAFDPATWKRLGFFALVRPKDDILPVRSIYNGSSPNIGSNRLTSNEPLWFAGPDVVASILLTGKVPHLVRAIRMVPQGKQKGLRQTNLRGLVTVNPKTDDFFRFVVEQRERVSKSNEALGAFLKTLASAGSYGLFVEVNPRPSKRGAKVTVYSGDSPQRCPTAILEQPGRWYYPPIASLITAGGRLLLAMLERRVVSRGGSFLFCDTDSLCIVGDQSRRWLPCAGGPVTKSGVEGVVVQSRRDVEQLVEEFGRLNPYDRKLVPKILKIEAVNTDADGKPRSLRGLAISAKRYALYEWQGEIPHLIEPKAHGLGYLYPPVAEDEGPPWHADAWEWLLRDILHLPQIRPGWFSRPALMRVALSTPQVLRSLPLTMRPFNFLFYVLVDGVVGYPQGTDPECFTLIAPFSKKPHEWMNATCQNTHDGGLYRLSLEQSPEFDRVIPQTFETLLARYRDHVESKSLAPNGERCEAGTRGVLQRSRVVVAQHRLIGKEAERRWEHGDDLSLADSKILEYRPALKTTTNLQSLRRAVRTVGFRESVRRSGLSQHTIERILAGEPVRPRTLARLVAALKEAGD